VAASIGEGVDYQTMSLIASGVWECADCGHCWAKVLELCVIRGPNHVVDDGLDEENVGLWKLGLVDLSVLRNVLWCDEEPGADKTRAGG
jgi:hypothetical protein